MSGYLPAIPFGGVAGWVFLTRTADTQAEAHAVSPIQSREAEYFRSRISEIRTAEDLVADRRLLSIALTAYGLEDDLPNRYFIRKVLESDPSDKQALAFRLADSRYGEMAKAFGFGSIFGPSTNRAGFAERVLANYRARSFEAAVGEQDPDMRLMLGLERELSSVLSQSSGADARWFAVMGTPPLRQVFETALGLPASFGALDLDRQLAEFRTRSEAVFGTSDLAELAGESRLEDVRSQYLLRSQVTATTVASPALQLLAGAVEAGALFAARTGA